MNTTNLRKPLTIAAASIALIALADTAHAILLAPGGSAFGVGTPTEVNGTILSDTNVPYNFSDVQGNIEEIVAKEVGGTLDFYFQAHETGNTGAVSQLSFNYFAGYTTDAFYDTRGTGATTIVGTDPLSGKVGASNPTNGVDTFARTSDGNAVQFTWNKNSLLGTVTTIANGEYSPWLVIRTNATTYGAGQVGVSDGLTQNFISIGPVPEPGTLGFGIGLGMVSLVTRFRRKVAIA